MLFCQLLYSFNACNLTLHLSQTALCKKLDKFFKCQKCTLSRIELKAGSSSPDCARQGEEGSSNGGAGEVTVGGDIKKEKKK